MKIIKLTKKQSPVYRYRVYIDGKMYYAINKHDIEKRILTPADYPCWG